VSIITPKKRPPSAQILVGDALGAALDEIDREYRTARATEGPHVIGWSPPADWLRR